MTRLIIQLGRSRMIISLIVVIGFVGGYLSYSGSEDPVILVDDKSAKDDLKLFDNFDLDFSILEDSRYKSLEIFGENPVNAGVTGEIKDPFEEL